MMRRWNDISVLVGPGMTVWPGDSDVMLSRFASMEAGDACNVSRISMSAHAGTHVDAPLHYVDRGIDVAHVPIESLTGRARVIGIRGIRRIGAREILQHSPERGEILLIKTDNSEREWWKLPFDPDFCRLTPGAAEELVAAGVRAVGIDGLSVGGPDEEGDRVHRILLTNTVTVIEGLALNDAPWGKCELMCLPLRLDGGDGAPARALIRPL